MTAYPFFGDVAQTIGRLLRLQDNVSAVQMQRRLKERYGEKETVARAARRIQGTFVDWRVLAASGAKGTYVSAPRLGVTDAELLVWMIEALLRSSDGGMKSVDDIRHSLAFFPFDISSADVMALPINDRLDIFRQGAGEQWVRLR
jgi:hypothetical protein